MGGDFGTSFGAGFARVTDLLARDAANKIAISAGPRGAFWLVMIAVLVGRTAIGDMPVQWNVLFAAISHAPPVPDRRGKSPQCPDGCGSSRSGCDHGCAGQTAIFPLLLAVVTILGFVGEKSLGSEVVSTLHKFPVVGDSFNPANSQHLHGSTIGLVVGLAGLIYGAQGVTQTAQQAMATIWAVPEFERTGFLPRLGRSLAGLATISGAFLINALVAGYVTKTGEGLNTRIPVLAALIVVNSLLYWASFAILTPRSAPPASLIPGAIAGSVAFTALITVGTGLVTHQLKNASNTYGTFGSVIGIVIFLLLLSKLSIYAAELNPVLNRRLSPEPCRWGR